MAKYLKIFSTTQQYTSYMGNDPFLPNVSLCEDTNGVHFTALVPVTGITLDKQNIDLEPGGSTTVTATVLPANASDKSVTWSTSDGNKVSITGSGSTVTLTAVNGGSATITCKSASDNTKTASVSVTVIEMLPADMLSFKEKQRGISTNFTVNPSYPDDPAEIMDSTFEDMNMTTSRIFKYAVGVPAGKFSHNYVETFVNADYRINSVGGTGGTINGAALQTGSHYSSLTYDSTSDGKDWYKLTEWTIVLNANSDAFGNIYIYCDGNHIGDVLVELENPTVVPITSFTLDKDNMILFNSEASPLEVTIKPSTASQDVTWTTSNSSVATVSSSGKNATVTAAANGSGTATITCTSTQDSTKTASATVSVPQAKLQLEAQDFYYFWEFDYGGSNFTIYDNVAEAAVPNIIDLHVRSGVEYGVSPWLYVAYNKSTGIRPDSSNLDKNLYITIEAYTQGENVYINGNKTKSATWQGYLTADTHGNVPTDDGKGHIQMMLGSPGTFALEGIEDDYEEIGVRATLYWDTGGPAMPKIATLDYNISLTINN